MNKERLLKVSLTLDNLPSTFHFDMGVWLKETPCGTACCIAGLTVLLFPEEAEDIFNGPITHTANISLIAEEILNLDPPQADQLFCPSDLNRPWSSITPTEAARVIRHLVRTGQVDWTAIEPRP